MRCTNREGVSLIWTVLMLPVFIGFVGLAIDVGYAVWVAQQLQIAADAAALGSAPYLSQTEELARSAAQLVAERNAAAGDAVEIDPAVDIDFGAYDRATRTFQPAAFASGNAVRVTARRTDDSPNGPLALLFGPALGVATINLQREAIALRSGGEGGEGLAVLHSDQPAAFEVSGNGRLNVVGGGIHVNSAHHEGTVLQGNASVYMTEPVVEGGWTGDAPALSVTGGVKMTGNSSVVPPSIHCGAPPTPDPLGFLELSEHVGDLHAMMDGPALDYNGKAPTAWPGYYPNGIRVAANRSLTVLPGIYVLGGDGLKVSGNASLYADGALFFITGDSATLDLSGNGNVHIGPYRSDGSPFDGMSVFRDYRKPGDPTQPVCKVTGNSDFFIEGTLYIPHAHLALRGNNTTVGNRIIVRTIEVTGNGEITINRQGMGYEDQLGSVFLVS